MNSNRLPATPRRGHRLTNQQSPATEANKQTLTQIQLIVMCWDKGQIRTVNKTLQEHGGVPGEFLAKSFVDLDHLDRKKCNLKI